MTYPDPARPGEVLLDIDPDTVHGPSLVYIGRIRSPWAKGSSPRNLREARVTGGTFSVQIDPPYRAGLLGLSAGDAIVLLYWMDAARRDLIVQSLAHRDGPAGTFALRSPARPNPIALAVVRIQAIEADCGLLTIDATDAFDGTPVLDIKPWIASVDVPASSEG
jgi:tRNA-Thr(GGU) m(6)t(6)A37 methyltransferase TsaA